MGAKPAVDLTTVVLSVLLGTAVVSFMALGSVLRILEKVVYRASACRKGPGATHHGQGGAAVLRRQDQVLQGAVRVQDLLHDVARRHGDGRHVLRHGRANVAHRGGAWK